MLRPLIRAVTWCALILTLTSAVGAQSDPVSDPAAGGHTLPIPFGLGLTVYSQTQDYKLASLQLGIPGFDAVLDQALPVDNRTDSYHLKLDYWVLPFLNIYAVGGRLETTTTVSLRGVDTGLPFQLNNLRIENDGWVYGGGVTVAGGWNQWFTTVSVTYTEADLEVTDHLMLILEAGFGARQHTMLSLEYRF